MSKRPLAGFTIIEMLISMALFSLLGTLVVGVIVKNLRDNEKLQANSVVQRDLNLAIDRMNRVFRSTTQIIDATATSVRIRGYPNAGDVAPSEIYFYTSTTAGKTSVKYDVIPPTGTAPSYTYNPANAVTHLLLPRVTNSSTVPLFTYYDQNNTLLATPITLAKVTVIQAAPSALDENNFLSTPIVVTTRATLRNFKTNL